MTPFFLIGFPLMGVPRLSTVAAIGAALFLETSGFGTAVFRYLRMRLADLKSPGALILITTPWLATGAGLTQLFGAAWEMDAIALRPLPGVSTPGWITGGIQRQVHVQSDGIA